MSEPTKENMLEALEKMETIWISGWRGTWIGDEREKICQAIRHLIEQWKPKVTRKFVKKWGQILFENTPEVQLNTEIWEKRVLEILQEASVEVSNEG